MAIAVGAAAAAAAAAGARGSAATAPARRWGGTWIRSLDAPRKAALHEATEGSATATPSATPPVPSDQVLSNESTFTRWAFVASPETVYASPNSSSRRVGRLHWYTEDGFSEIYLLLRAHWDAHGQEWVRLRIPARPNGQTGWVRRAALGNFHLTHTLVVVDRARLRMSFYAGGRRLWSAPVGVGKPSTPTPAGHYWVRERFKILDPRSGYWPYAFGTSDYSTLSDWPGGGVVGIHGPYYAPQQIPGRISHGCVRLRVSDDFWLAGHIQLGTPVHVI